MKVTARDPQDAEELELLVQTACAGGLTLVKESLAKRVWCSHGRRPLYVKEHRPRGLLERLKHRLRGSRAEREHHMIRALQERGVSCVDSLGFASYGRAGASYVIVSKAPGEELGPALAEMEPERRRECVTALAGFVRKMHSSGVTHGDLHPGNLFVENGTFTIIDPQKCRIRRSVGERAVLRDVAQLAMGIESAAGPEYAEAFLSTYWAGDAGHIRRTTTRIERLKRCRLRSRAKRCVKESTRFRHVSRGGWRVNILRSEASNVETWTAGVETEEVFFKERLYRGPAGWIRLPVRAGRLYRAWRNAHRLALLKLPVVEHLAYMRRVGLFRSRERLVMRRVEEDLARRVWRLVFEGDTASLRRLAETVARLVSSMTEKGVWHADFKASNLLVEGEELYLGDLEAARVGGATEWRLCQMFAQLQASLPRCVPLSLALRAFVLALRDTPFRDARRNMLRRVESLASARRDRWIETVRLRGPLRTE